MRNLIGLVHIFISHSFLYSVHFDYGKLLALIFSLFVVPHLKFLGFLSLNTEKEIRCKVNKVIVPNQELLTELVSERQNLEHPDKKGQSFEILDKGLHIPSAV